MEKVIIELDQKWVKRINSPLGKSSQILSGLYRFHSHLYFSICMGKEIILFSALLGLVYLFVGELFYYPDCSISH
jgi:hypothetical protein